MSALPSQTAPVRRSTRTGTVGTPCPCGIRVPPHSTHECGPVSDLGTKVERILLRAQEDIDVLVADLDEERRAHAAKIAAHDRLYATWVDVDRRMDVVREAAKRLRPMARLALEAGADSEAARDLFEAIAYIGIGCPDLRSEEDQT